jgi:8-oxo-dGTP diphosphatase
MNQENIVQKVVVGGVLIHDGKVLILQRNENEGIYPGMWELPSGKKELLEKTEDALVREFKEEVGIEVTVIAPISVFDYQITKNTEIRDSVQINFLVASVNTIEVKISGEHQAYEWIGEADIVRYDLSDATKAVVRKAFSFYRLTHSK